MSASFYLFILRQKDTLSIIQILPFGGWNNGWCAHVYFSPACCEGDKHAVWDVFRLCWVVYSHYNCAAYAARLDSHGRAFDWIAETGLSSKTWFARHGCWCVSFSATVVYCVCFHGGRNALRNVLLMQVEALQQCCSVVCDPLLVKISHHRPPFNSVSIRRGAVGVMSTSDYLQSCSSP